MNRAEIIKEILEMQTVAVVGFSPNKARPSHYVSMYMQQNGYDIIPVNPGHREIDGMVCYPMLESIQKPIDVVDIFRRSEFVPKIVDSGSLNGISEIIGIKGATLPPVVEIIYVIIRVKNPSPTLNSSNNFALFFIQNRLSCR